jgi:antitoxin (DNA-binding transcriptional repressor) of toxin-antitoxin stability system
MRRVNLRQLHHETGRIIAAVAEGETILIERRGSVVAELHPPRARPSREKAIPEEHWTWLDQFPEIPGDSTDSISQDRDRWS